MLQGAVDYSKGGSGKHLTTQSMLEGRSRRMEDGSNNGIITYRRKKRSLNAQLPETISSSEAGLDEPVEKKNNVKKDDIVTYKRKKREAAKESPVYVSSEGNSSSKACSLKLGLQSHPKDLRRRRSVAYVQIIARLGLSLASCSMDATHFIADQFARTRNMLEFIALGKPVVTHLWLESCGEANCLIIEKSYILRDAKKEKESGFNMLVSLDSAKRCPLLKDRKSWNIKRNVHKLGEDSSGRRICCYLCDSVVTSSGETQLSTAKGKRILDELLKLSCEKDEAICLPFLEKSTAVYSSELLQNGIVIQRLEHNRHQLFANVVKKARP